MEVNKLFDTFHDVQVALESYKNENNVEFYIDDSKTLQAARKNCPKRTEGVSEALKYYFVKFRCVHGGSFKKNKKSTGVRNTSTLRQECPAYIHLRLDDSKKHLMVSKMSETHNHEVSSAIFQYYRNQRKLTPELTQNVLEMCELRANKKLIQHKVQEATGKVITMRDITNIAAAGKKKNANNLEDVVKELQGKYQCDVRLSADEANNLKGIFMQDMDMKKIFSAYPEIIFADSTYKLLDLQIPVFVLLAEDGNGQSEVVAIGLLVNEDETTLKWFFETFETLNPATSKMKVVMTDKDLTERAAIKKVFPDVHLRICLFHTQRTFKREITCDKMGITPAQRDLAKQILEKLCYARTVTEYDDLYKVLEESVPPTVFNYFNTYWHPFREEWTAISTFNSDTYFNRTNNRLECFNSKMKSVIPYFSSLQEFTEKLFILLKCLRSERDSKAISLLQKVSTVSFEDDNYRSYFNFLTPYAYEYVKKQLVSMGSVHNCYADLMTSEKSCNCLFFNSMNLPCKHILAFRKAKNLSLFDEELCDNRWRRNYYYKNHRAYETFDSFSISQADPGTSNISIVETNPLKLLTTHQKFTKAASITTKIATVVSQFSNVHFERKIEFLQLLLQHWSDGREVMLTEVSRPATEFYDTVPQDFSVTNLLENTTEVYDDIIEELSPNEEMISAIEFCDAIIEKNTDVAMECHEHTEQPLQDDNITVEDVAVVDRHNIKQAQRKDYSLPIVEVALDNIGSVGDFNERHILSLVAESGHLNENILSATSEYAANFEENVQTLVTKEHSYAAEYRSDTNLSISEESVNISQLQVPSKIKIRGRPKGITQTAIGLPKKRGKTVTAFSKKHYIEQQSIILSWVLGNTPERIIQGNDLITPADIRPEKLHLSIFSENVNVHIVRNFFTDSAWKKLEETMMVRGLTETKICPVCNKDINDDNRIMCQSCLLWHHFKCAGVFKNSRKRNWYCITCVN